jgi:hypothetical protein
MFVPAPIDKNCAPCSNRRVLRRHLRASLC